MKIKVTGAFETLPIRRVLPEICMVKSCLLSTDSFSRRTLFSQASYCCMSLSIFSHCVNQLRSSPAGNLTESQTCVIPEDCELSPWSQWTPHNSSCIDTDGQLRQGYMVHTRSIINLPLGTGRPCQSLVHYFPLKTQNEKLCVRLVFCFYRIVHHAGCKTKYGLRP